MPIKGLTDRELAFPIIGTIRKGAPKEQGKRPQDLTYFRVEFDERESEAESLFRQLYGDKPTDIQVVLPFDDIDRCWDAHLEAYQAGRMVAKSDGEIMIKWDDPSTGTPIARNGEYLPESGKVGIARCPEDLCVGLDYKGGKVYMKPSGRLRVIVPKLMRGAYMEVKTHSYTDIGNLSSNALAIRSINGGRLAGVPLILKRRPQDISVPMGNGKRTYKKMWVLSLEADPDWVKSKLYELHTLALPATQAPALPMGQEDTEWYSDDEEELAAMVDDIVITDVEAPVEIQSFEQEQGRPPVAGEDYDPDGSFSEEDYAYLAGESTENIVVVPDPVEEAIDALTGEAPVKVSEETILTMTNSKGEKYTSLDNEKLSNMTIGLGKAIAGIKDKGVYNLNETEIGNLNKYLLKMEVIKAILQGRTQGKYGPK